MTDEEMNINITIAKACGFKYHDWSTHQMPYWTDPQGKTSGVSNYCHDLNAMHEAEETLMTEKSCKLWREYTDILLTIVPPGYGDSTFVHATARQRAEAFLKLKASSWFGKETHLL